MTPDHDSEHQPATLVMGHHHENHYYSLEDIQTVKGRKELKTTKLTTQPVCISQVSKGQVNSIQLTKQFLVIDAVPSMTGEGVINNMDAPVEGFYNTEYTHDPILNDSYTLLGLNNNSRFWAAIYDKKYSEKMTQFEITLLLAHTVILHHT